MEINFASAENVEAYATREGSGIAKESNIFKEVFTGEAYATTRGSGIACQ